MSISSEMVAVSHSYVPHGINLGVPSIYMPAQGQHILNRAPMLYKGIPAPQNLIPPVRDLMNLLITVGFAC